MEVVVVDVGTWDGDALSACDCDVLGARVKRAPFVTFGVFELSPLLLRCAVRRWMHRTRR